MSKSTSSSGKIKGSKKNKVIKRESSVNEETKRRLIIKGSKCKENIQLLLKDLVKLFPKMYTKIVGGISKGELITTPWEDQIKMERLAYKHGAAMSIFANSSKKHPFRLIFTRYYDCNIMEMYEFNVLNYRGMFSNLDLPKYGSKPIVICQGSPFESNEVYRSLRNMFLDLFSGPIIRGSKISLKGFDHLVLITAYESKKEESKDGNIISKRSESNIRIDIRNYIINLGKKENSDLTYFYSDEKLIQYGSPRASITQIGLKINMELTRHQVPDKSILKSALAVPSEIKSKKVKNVKTNVMGEKVGKIHIGKQDLSELNTPHAGILSRINKSNR
ncbi:hypothetical protein FG386_000508 [Cryptosporidium ryanae]|uniref:uncharacterized protein n=1 Tax=Cryptosporidium ryanae TaxID=515981 RepID=UPI00351A205C|nr:hypothetical protein FG386_000508 [Cryptosporidium ryanae]